MFIIREKDVNLMIKMMKDMKELRKVVKLDQMTNNELMVYELIIPYYKEMLEETGGEFDGDWAPRLYYGYYGKIPGKNLNKSSKIFNSN